jgi:ABC-2 type transport system permease protein
LASPRAGDWPLLRKEWHELLASRAWWIFLALMGPLVGVAFISAVRTYGEASGRGGTAAGVGEAFSPLVGIWAPTFSACELAAAFLLPFVAIRMVAGDKQSGALKIESQLAVATWVRVAVKAAVLLAGWLIASLAVAAAVLLWAAYGGSIYAPELGAVVLGHLLNAGFTIALACAAAAVAEHPSTAAIITLGVTVGTWIVSFIAAIHGGFWERLVAYTPTAMVGQFQHGLVRLDSLLITLALIVAGLALAAIWIRIGVAVRRRVWSSLAVVGIAAVFVGAFSMVRPSWDLSENRMNSFARADEAALRTIAWPVRIRVHLAPEDPRRVDLERRTLSKLRRVLPNLRVEYVSATSIGLFEQTTAGYGEIEYELNGRTASSRATTPEAVLENVYSLAGVTPSADNDDGFRGHPLDVVPRGAAGVFYVAWPAVVLACAVLSYRRSM